jgi:ubiquinone/menaquinone biosynthesis C-methylase UbiE
VVDSIKNELDISRYQNVIDVGCGNGALCSVLYQKGLSVTGVDQSPKMLNIALKQAENKNITFINANFLPNLSFDDKSFDIAITAYVAHGLHQSERKQLYAEMARLARHMVIIYDYNKNRSLLTTISEWIEHGDYFGFIKNAEIEMKTYVSNKTSCFKTVKVVNVDIRAAWYICTPI